METNHTPIPWEIHHCGDRSPEIHPFADETGETVIADVCDFETAAFIVRACNSHADLLAALEEAERVIRWAAQEASGRVNREIVGGWVHHADAARSAIAKARGE